VNIPTSIVNNIVFPNWDKDKTLFSAILLVTKGTKRLATKEDIPIKMGTSNLIFNILA